MENDRLTYFFYVPLMWKGILIIKLLGVLLMVSVPVGLLTVPFSHHIITSKLFLPYVVIVCGCQKCISHLKWSMY